MIVYLIRHGETTGDVEDRYGGTYDDGLTEQGFAQARSLAMTLGGKGIERLFASPLRRAQQTALEVARDLALEVDTISEFRERNSYGILSGLTRAEAKQTHPDLVDMLGDYKYAIEGAEAYVDFQSRIVKALSGLNGIRANTIAVVTHGGVLRMIYRDILSRGEISVGDCAFVVLDTVAGNYRIVTSEGINVHEAAK